MKIAGQEIRPPENLVVVIPRQSGDIILKCKAVLDFSEFDARCPRPEMPDKILRGGRRVPDPDNPKYKELLDDWAIKRTNWIFIKSLEATENLEWEKIDINDPETWKNFYDELKESGFSDIEILKIQQTVFDACGLNQEKIEEATKRFLAEMGQM